MQKMETMETRLCKLVMKGNCEGVNKLLINDIEILRGVTPQGNSALHIAAARGHHNMVELLVTQMPCMLSMKNSNQETPLHTAARSGNSKVIEVLLNVDNVFQCNCKSPSCVIDLEASPIEVQVIWRAQNKMGETALHYAVKRNYLEAVEQLLYKVEGIALIVNNEGESPLYTACYYDCLEIGKRFLLEDPAIGDARIDGTSCLHQAIINILRWRDEGNDKLRWHDIALKLAFHLVRKRPQLAEAIDPSGNSPLHLLAALPFPDKLHLELVKELLKARANMNFRLNKDDMAPIHIAARDGNAKVLSCLISSAPQCSFLLGKEKKNALHFALEHDHGVSLVHKLSCLLEDPVDIGFLVNEPDNEGKTAISIADEAPDGILKPALKQFILQEMWGTSPPGPNIFKKEDASNSSQQDFRKKVTLHETKGGQCKEEMEGEDPSERLSVIAALITTITFAAAFIIPLAFNDVNDSLVIMHGAAFKTFILFDSLALSLSIMSLVQLIYRPTTGVYKLSYNALEKFFGRRELIKCVCTRKHFEQKLTRWGRRYLLWSLMAMMVAFATGVYVVIAPRCLWLAITVCIITFGGFVLEMIVETVLLIWMFWLIWRGLWQAFWQEFRQVL